MKDAQYTKHDIHWTFARGIVTGVFATCAAIVGLLQLASIIKGLLQ